MTDSQSLPAGQETRCGFVALIGAPNAGKSTLTNRLVGSKIAIVTPKAQTTRSRLRGICMADARTQLILIDTPGIFQAKERLDRAMVRAAWDSLSEADAVCLLVDARKGLTDEVRRIMEQYPDEHGKLTLLLNKVDAVKKEKLLDLALAAQASAKFGDIFMISAQTGDGVEDVRHFLAGRMPAGPWLYPPDQLADINERLLASEITREKLFMQLQQELPYALTVETESWQDDASGAARIDQVIYVERESQKAIVLGKGGQRLKAVGSAARHELEELLGRRMHLFLHVKLRENWKDNPENYRYLGLEFDGR